MYKTGRCWNKAILVIAYNQSPRDCVKGDGVAQGSAASISKGGDGDGAQAGDGPGRSPGQVLEPHPRVSAVHTGQPPIRLPGIVLPLCPRRRG
jgi:hypothetical protein